MSTAQQIITTAYQMIGYLSANETMSAADSALGLDQLNKMLDSWSNSPQACFAVTEQSFPLVPGKSSYKIGTSGGADVNATRPLRIIEGPGAAYIQDGNGNNYPVDVVPRDQWNQLANRGPNTTSDIPDTLFYDPQSPLGVLNVWPNPTMAYTLYFDSYQQLGNMANLTASFSLPPGYELAIQSNLAVLLGPFCKGALVSQDVKDIARTSLAAIKRTNKRNTVAQFDRELSSSAQATYNPYTGRYQ